MQIFQQIMQCTRWEKIHNNVVATTIAKYLPKKQMLVFVKGFYCYLVFIMIYENMTFPKTYFKLNKILLTFLINFTQALKKRTT